MELNSDKPSSGEHNYQESCELQKEFSANTTVKTIIDRWACKTPEANAFYAPDNKPLTYSHLNSQIEYVVESLNAMGVGRNDPVALVLPNGPDLAVAFFGVVCGATAAPLNPNYTEAEFRFYLSDLKAKALIVESGSDSASQQVARELDVKIIELESKPGEQAGVFTLKGDPGVEPEKTGYAKPDDVALVLHTSGTTSRPKLVPLTHTNICASAISISKVLELSTQDKCLNVMPLFHIHSLIGTSLPTLISGASIVYTPQFQVPSFYTWLDEFKPTWYTGSPTIHQAVLNFSDEYKDIIVRSNLRFIRSSSAPLAPNVLIDLEKAFHAPVVESYGMTEAAYLIASNPLPPGKRKIGSVGQAAGLELAIMDSGKLLPPGQVGEIVLKGENIMKGYGHEPDNKNAFRNGWFRTGDQGYMDEEGYVFITGRLKEIINRGGEKISPRQVDETLLQHPEINEAVAFAIEHNLLGEEIAAAVVLKQGSKLTEWDIQEYAAEHLAYFKVPKFVLILNDLPKGPTGKVQRIGLAERLSIQISGKRSEGEERSPDSIIKEVMARMLSDLPNDEFLSEHDYYMGKGGFSLLWGEVNARAHDALLMTNLKLDDEMKAPTIEKMAQIYNIKGAKVKPTSLIELKTKGSRIPIFCVHTDDGTLDYASELVNSFDISQPFYGLKAHGLESLDTPFDNIPDMATHYVNELKLVQPHGPYIFMGSKMGGLIAIEMAQQLIWQGEEVELVALFDTQPTSIIQRGLLGEISHSIRKLFNWRKWKNTRQNLSSDSMNLQLRLKERIYNLNKAAAKKYQQKPYPSKVLLFLSQEHDDFLGTPEELAEAWETSISGRFEYYIVSDDKTSLLTGVNLKHIVKNLKEHLSNY